MKKTNLLLQQRNQNKKNTLTNCLIPFKVQLWLKRKWPYWNRPQLIQFLIDLKKIL